MKIIPITKGLVTKVSDKDYTLLSKHRWRAIRIAGRGRSGKTYRYGFKVGRTVKGKMVWMHNVVCPSVPGKEIDHRDGDTLNNTRRNLRSVPHWANCLNRGKRSDGVTSKYLGVCKMADKRRFSAFIFDRSVRKHRHLGYYDTEEEAALVYDRVAKRLNGKYARLNFRR
jgi:hypothetical protein